MRSAASEKVLRTSPASPSSEADVASTRTLMTDQDLIEAYANQADVESFSTFIHRYQDPLMRFVTKMLGDGEAAHDVVQETFLQVAECPKKLLKVENCHNWLLRVARNLGIDQMRRRKTAQKHATAVAEHNERVRSTDGAQASPAAALEKSELQAQVHAEIDKLKPRQRELVILKVVEQKSYKEIAAITGMSVTNVGYQLHQAMKTLSHRLAPKREELL